MRSLRKLTTATLPEDETAPTARPDCRNALLNIIVRDHKQSKGKGEEVADAIGVGREER